MQGPDRASNSVQAGFALIFLIRLCKDKGLAHAAVLKSCRSAYLGLLLGLGMKGQGKKLYMFHMVLPIVGSIF